MQATQRAAAGAHLPSGSCRVHSLDGAVAWPRQSRGPASGAWQPAAPPRWAAARPARRPTREDGARRSGHCQGTRTTYNSQIQLPRSPENQCRGTVGERDHHWGRYLRRVSVHHCPLGVGTKHTDLVCAGTACHTAAQGGWLRVLPRMVQFRWRSIQVANAYTLKLTVEQLNAKQAVCVRLNAVLRPSAPFSAVSSSPVSETRALPANVF